MKKLILLLVFSFFTFSSFSQSPPPATFKVTGFAGTGNCDGVLNISVCTGPGFPTYTVSPFGGNSCCFTNMCPMTYTVGCNMAGWFYYFLVNYSNNTVTVSSPSLGTTVFSAFASVTSSTQLFPNCNGMITLNIQGGTQPYIITWYDNTGNVVPGQTNDTLPAVCPANYGFKVDDSGTCGPSVYSGWVFRVPGLSCNLQVKNASCYGQCDGSVKTIPGGTGQAIISKNVTYNATTVADSMTNACAGVYTGSVMDATHAQCSCTDTVKQPAQLNLQLNSVQNSTGSNGSIQFTSTGATPPYHATLNGANTIYFNSGQQSYSGLAPGNYTITVADTNGCPQTITAQVNSSAGIAQANQSYITIFPNPAKNTVTVKNVTAGEEKIQLKNITGSDLMISPKFTNEKEALIDLSEVSGGIYFLQITNLHSGEVITRKVILEK